MLERYLRRRVKRVVGEDQLDTVQLEELLELPDERVLRLRQDAHQRVLVQRVQRHDDRDATDELGYQPVAEQVVVSDVLQQLVRGLGRVTVLQRARPETKTARALPDPLVDDRVEPLEGAAEYEQHSPRC